MFVSTTDIPAGVNCQILGMVRGNIVFATHIGKDLMAGFKNIVGGEIRSYTEMTNDARSTAEQRMIAEAVNLGADAIYCMRFQSETVVQGSTDMLCYGTAVKFL